MSNVAKSLYIPLSTAASIGGGLLAGKIFSLLWKQVDDAEPPDPQNLRDPLPSVLFAAVLQGVTWGLVRATVQRAGAHSYRALTEETPPS